MNRRCIPSLCAVLMITQSIFALSGSVTSNNGQPAAGAIVRLTNAEVSDTIGPDGTFMLDARSDVRIPGVPHLAYRRPMQIGNRILFSLHKPSQVSIDLYSQNGRLVESREKIFGEGNHMIDAIERNRPLAAGIYIVRFRSRDYAVSFKLAYTGRGVIGSKTTGISGTLPEIRKASMAARTATEAIDTLIISKVSGDSIVNIRKLLVYSYDAALGNQYFFIDPDADIDDDGLTNYEERYVFFTDPRKADTDGDGWDDFEETTKYQANDPFRFNNLIADMPEIELEIVGYPKIVYHYRTEAGVEKAVEISEGREFGNSYTSSSSTEVNASFEFSLMLGAEVKAGPEGGVTGKVEATTTLGAGIATSWGQENSVSFAENYNRAVAETQSQTVSFEGGEISLGIQFSNSSNIAYTLTDPVLTAYTVDWQSDGEVSKYYWGEWVLEGGGAIPPIDPNGRTEPRVVKKEFQSKEEIEYLARVADGMVWKLSGYSIAMGERTFDTEKTNVYNQTAQVTIDFGSQSGKSIIREQVATLTRFNEFYTSINDMYRPVTLGELLRTMQIDYVVDTANGKSGITEIEGIAHDDQSRRYWFVTITSSNDSATFYSINLHSYDPEKISVYTTDQVAFIYTGDSDGDGLPMRLEAGLGTCDTLTDSDADSLSDSDEFAGWLLDPEDSTSLVRTDPALWDTDFDSLSDKSDPDPLLHDLDTPSPSVAIDYIALTGSSSGYYHLSARDDPGGSHPVNQAFSGESLLVTIDAARKMGWVIIDQQDGAISDTLLLMDREEGQYSATIGLKPGTNSFTIKLVSSDYSTTASCILSGITYQLPAWSPSALLVQNDQVNTYKQLRVTLQQTDEVMEQNAMAQGVLVFRSTTYSSPSLSTVVGSELPYSHGVRYQINDRSGTPQSYTALLLSRAECLQAQARTIIDSGLTPGTWYFYHVYTYGSDGANVYYAPRTTPGSAETKGKMRVEMSYNLKIVDCSDFGPTIFTEGPDEPYGFVWINSDTLRFSHSLDDGESAGSGPKTVSLTHTGVMNFGFDLREDDPNEDDIIRWVRFTGFQGKDLTETRALPFADFQMVRSDQLGDKYKGTSRLSPTNFKWGDSGATNGEAEFTVTYEWEYID